MSVFENLTQFHFLRPFWLCGLLVLPPIWFTIRQRALAGTDWSNAIDPELLGHLTPKGKSKSKRYAQRNMLWILALSFIALAGPTWQQKPQPVIKVTDNMVIILDLSLSMLATDTAPDRLTRAKQKLQDLLKLRTEGNTALIVFSGDAHVVTPLTDDTNTIIANLPALDPFIMPLIGSRPDLAVKQALLLLKQGKANEGRIILITDGVEEHQITKIKDTLKGSQVTLSILAAGTAAGGPINLPERGYLKDGDKVVIPRTDFESLRELASNNGGQMFALTLDDHDLQGLDVGGQLKRQQNDGQQTIDQRFDTWEDMGYLLLLLIIPLALMAHRQGAVIVLLLFLLPVEKSMAFGWDDLWQTKDQQAQELLESGQAQQAAETFRSAEHKAYAQYLAQQYEQAAASYGQLSSADARYNQGNALAQQQQFEEAIKAYQEALKLNPEHEDAKYNKQLIEDFLKQQEQQEQQQDQQSNQDGEQQDNANQQQDKSGDSKRQQEQQQQQQQQQKSEQQQGRDAAQDQQAQQDQQQEPQNQEHQQQDTQEQRDEQAQQQGEQRQPEQQQKDKQQAKQQAASQNQEQDEPDNAESQTGIEAELDELSEEEKQSYDQWMRRVPDDPGGLLRRKFEQQARDRNRTERDAGEPVW